jgi:hypothetical protein
MLCNGRGQTTCTVCGGAGATFLSKSRLGYNGRIEYYQERVACTLCFGTGRVMCQACGGVGTALQGQQASVQNVPSSQPSPPSSSQAQGSAAPFPFVPSQFVYHPKRQDVWACWQYNPGNVLDVGWSSTQTTRIDVTACPRGKWLTVRGDGGYSVPLAVFIGPAGEFLGRWL